MAYGLPNRGQHDWDDELNNSIESLRADVQSAVSAAASAQSNANDARSLAQNLTVATFAYKAMARNPDLLISGPITRDTNGAATSAPVTWPDGTTGTYTATTVSTAFPGAVDAYTITYGSPVTKTYTQPAITRDATTGATTNVPPIVVT